MRACAAAARLHQQSFGRGERALIMLDNGDGYVVSLRLPVRGRSPMPVFPPGPRKRHLGKLEGIAADAGACCVLTHADIKASIAAAEAFADVPLIAVDAIGTDDADRWVPHQPSAADAAFLQYTSGSTSAPKGVMVTHANLMANMRAIEEGLSVGPDDIFATRLPAQPRHGPDRPPAAAAPQHPGRADVAALLPRAAGALARSHLPRHRATIGNGPDFAYRLCLERVSEAQLQKLDLSSWALAFSGAEPVRAAALHEFKRQFAPAGFAAGAVYLLWHGRIHAVRDGRLAWCRHGRPGFSSQGGARRRS